MSCLLLEINYELDLILHQEHLPEEVIEVCQPLIYMFIDSLNGGVTIINFHITNELIFVTALIDGRRDYAGLTCA